MTQINLGDVKGHENANSRQDPKRYLSKGYYYLHLGKVGKISSLSALWCNVTLPAILYGTDVVPITESVIQQ